MKTDLFGRPYVDPQRAAQIPLFHEPVKVETPDRRDAIDMRYAGRFDPDATGDLYAAEQDPNRPR